MHFLSAQCRVCKGDQFRAEPPETWVERVILPRLFLCPGRCVTCFKRRYLPTFQRWTALPNSWTDTIARLVLDGTLDPAIRPFGIERFTPAKAAE